MDARAGPVDRGVRGKRTQGGIPRARRRRSWRRPRRPRRDAARQPALPGSDARTAGARGRRNCCGRARRRGRRSAGPRHLARLGRRRSRRQPSHPDRGAGARRGDAAVPQLPLAAADDGDRRAAEADSLRRVRALRPLRRSGARRDLAARAGAAARAGEGGRRLSAARPRRRPPAPLDDEERRRLASLGYIASEARPGRPSDERAARRRHDAPVRDARPASRAFANGDYADAVPLFDGSSATIPGNLMSAVRLAVGAVVSRSRRGGARRASPPRADRSGSIEVDHYRAMHLLKERPRRRGRAALRAGARERSPSAFAALEGLAAFAPPKGDSPEAAALFERAVAVAGKPAPLLPSSDRSAWRWPTLRVRSPRSRRPAPPSRRASRTISSSASCTSRHGISTPRPRLSTACQPAHPALSDGALQARAGERPARRAGLRGPDPPRAGTRRQHHCSAHRPGAPVRRRLATGRPVQGGSVTDHSELSPLSKPSLKIGVWQSRTPRIAKSPETPSAQALYQAGGSMGRKAKIPFLPA